MLLIMRKVRNNVEEEIEKESYAGEIKELTNFCFCIDEHNFI